MAVLSDRELRLYDTDSGRLVATVTDAGPDQGDVAFSPSGTGMAATTGPYRIGLFDISSAARPHLMGEVQAPDAPVEQVAYAPQGDVLIVQSSTSTTFYDVADPADPVPLTTVPTNPGEDGLVLLDDGTLLSTARMTATGVDTESLPVHVIVTPLAVSSSAVVTPDRQTWPSSALWPTSNSGTSPIRCTRSSANRSVASRSVSAASPSPMTERFWQSGPLPASPSCGT